MIPSRHRRLGQCVPVSQPRTVVGSTPSRWTRSACDSPSPCRAARIRSPSLGPVSVGSYPRKRITPGSARRFGVAVPASQLKTVVLSTPIRNATSR